MYCFRRHSIRALLLLQLTALIAGCAREIRMQSPEIPPEVIDMSRIRLEPTEGTELEVRFGGERERPYLLMNLTFAGSGLNVIEEIKRGRILFHKIVVRDASGRILGEEPINFQAIKMTETRIQKSESDVYITSDNDQITLDRQDQNKDVIRRNYAIRTFADNDKVPQIVRLREMPDTNSPISVYVVLHLVEPVLKEVCKEMDGEACPVADYYTFREVREELSDVMRRIQQAYEKQEDLPAFRLKNSPDYYVKQMKENLSRMNATHKAPHENLKVLNISGQPATLYANVASFGSRLYYREWKLISEPGFFRVKVGKRPVKQH
jgi:hypothetical protein